MLENFWEFNNFIVSLIGIGIYLGFLDLVIDDLVMEVIIKLVKGGINLIDIVINYWY